MATQLTRVRALEVARTKLGTRENPPNSNSGPAVRVFQSATTLGGTGWPWCAAFVQFCFLKAGKPLEYRTASVGELTRWAKDRGYLVSSPAPGDIVTFDFNGNGVHDDHTGLVEEVGPGRIYTIEGNTAVGNDANGGMVMRRNRAMGAYCAYIRIPGTVTVADKIVKAPVKKAVAKAKAVATVIPYVIKLRQFHNSGIVTGIITVEPAGTPGGTEVKV
jgi:hypothetical protein